MRFSDGMKFNTDGEYRLTRRSDGWYVVGHGMLCPVDGPQDGSEFIKELEHKMKKQQEGYDD
ncbi:MAG TPA: hypothetical protein DEQ32_15485 [Gammaproteobacteria bacterium]|nr:hypothetical protein [Gammaproteobacteria bacterium]|tara:strand:- start:993 stop:1178 length:186 start_codon:yes stop_codon:yes gene_type:complete